MTRSPIWRKAWVKIQVNVTNVTLNDLKKVKWFDIRIVKLNVTNVTLNSTREAIWHSNKNDDKYFLYTLYLVFASPRRLSIKDMNMIVFVILDISSCVYFLTHAALTHWILGLVHMFLIPYPSAPFFSYNELGMSFVLSKYWISGLVSKFPFPSPPFSPQPSIWRFAFQCWNQILGLANILLTPQSYIWLIVWCWGNSSMVCQQNSDAL